MLAFFFLIAPLLLLSFTAQDMSKLKSIGAAQPHATSTNGWARTSATRVLKSLKQISTFCLDKEFSSGGRCSPLLLFATVPL